MPRTEWSEEKSEKKWFGCKGKSLKVPIQRSCGRKIKEAIDMTRRVIGIYPVYLDYVLKTIQGRQRWNKSRTIRGTGRVVKSNTRRC